MIHVCVQKFVMTENFENFWELNMFLVSTLRLFLTITYSSKKYSTFSYTC